MVLFCRHSSTDDLSITSLTDICRLVFVPIAFLCNRLQAYPMISSNFDVRSWLGRGNLTTIYIHMAVDADEHMFSPSVYMNCGLKSMRGIIVANLFLLPFALYCGRSKKKKYPVFMCGLSPCTNTKQMEATMSQNDLNNMQNQQEATMPQNDNSTVAPSITKAKKPPVKGVKQGVKRPLRRLQQGKLQELSVEFKRRLDNHKASVVRLELLVKRYADEQMYRNQAARDGEEETVIETVCEEKSV